MTKYVTMTVDGIYGGQFEAKNDADATIEARRRGYTVLDVTDADRADPYDAVVVVE